MVKVPKMNGGSWGVMGLLWGGSMAMAVPLLLGVIDGNAPKPTLRDWYVFLTYLIGWLLIVEVLFWGMKWELSRKDQTHPYRAAFNIKFALLGILGTISILAALIYRGTLLIIKNWEVVSKFLAGLSTVLGIIVLIVLVVWGWLWLNTLKLKKK